jgi:hypothetical protein
VVTAPAGWLSVGERVRWLRRLVWTAGRWAVADLLAEFGDSQLPSSASGPAGAAS